MYVWREIGIDTHVLCVSMYMYMYMYMYVYMHVYKMCVFIHTTYLPVTYVPTYGLHVHVYMCMCVCLWDHVCMCICTCRIHCCGSSPHWYVKKYACIAQITNVTFTYAYSMYVCM